MNLDSPVGILPFVGPIYQKRLEKLEINTIDNLLHHIPHRYLDFSKNSPIRDLVVEDFVTVSGNVVYAKNQYARSGRKIQLVEIEDKTGKILAVWFNQPFLVRTFYPGVKISIAGEVCWFGNKKAFISPEYEKISAKSERVHTGKIIGVYPETYGISSKWIRGRISKAYKETSCEIKEFLPEDILTKLNLSYLPDAIESVHYPKSLSEADSGRERLAFNELLMLQLANLHKKIKWQKNKLGNKLTINQLSVNQFIDSLPFKLTGSQEKAVKEILFDLSKDFPMNRLLEGDVGSGKTVVAAIAIFVAFSNGYQTIIMAPTQILAEQHFNTLNKLLHSFKVRISLITSEIKKSDVGRADVFVGTHALIHQKIDFEEVGLVVIDEQHRFGVEQRSHLIKKTGKKSVAPHVLTMTATPIPRTVALTFYGDLDLSTLDELPQGRQKITTWIVPPQKRESAYGWMKDQILKLKNQIFLVCPLIEESEKETLQQVKAATKEYVTLQKIFQEFKIGILHGRQPVKEKNKVLNDFRGRRINILVATPVVEVGIDVPNATIMVIEGAERFGLAQLHQLRGRVGRGEKKSYCLLFSDSHSQKALTRLNAMTKSISGFELAELDLKLRGPGEIFGTRQHGFPELKLASWNDIHLMKKAKTVAQDVFANPQKYPLLHKRLNLS